jgi:hypothetical protein
VSVYVCVFVGVCVCITSVARGTSAGGWVGTGVEIGDFHCGALPSFTSTGALFSYRSCCCRASTSTCNHYIVFVVCTHTIVSFMYTHTHSNVLLYLYTHIHTHTHIHPSTHHTHTPIHPYTQTVLTKQPDTAGFHCGTSASPCKAWSQLRGGGYMHQKRR